MNAYVFFNIQLVVFFIIQVQLKRSIVAQTGLQTATLKISDRSLYNEGNEINFISLMEVRRMADIL